MKKLLAVLLCLGLCEYATAPIETQAQNSPQNTINDQTFNEKYPNVYAYVQDFNYWKQTGTNTDRMKRFNKGTHGFECLSSSGIGEVAPMVCPDKFISEHIEDPSCVASERFYACCNYSGSVQRKEDILKEIQSRENNGI